jgi:hypothetical protein
MSSHVSTAVPLTATSNIIRLTLRLCAALLAVAGLIKVFQTGAILFGLVLIVPWVVVATRSRPGPRAALTAVIVGTLEFTLGGSHIAADGWSVEWFDLQVMIAAMTLGPVAVALGSYLLLRPRQT